MRASGPSCRHALKHAAADSRRASGPGVGCVGGRCEQAGRGGVLGGIVGPVQDRAQQLAGKIPFALPDQLLGQIEAWGGGGGV